MRRFLFLLLVFSLPVLLSGADLKKKKGISFSYLDEIHLQIEKDFIVFQPEEDSREMVMINSEGLLMVNHEEVPVSPRQRQLILTYMDHFNELQERAAEMAELGIEIGIRGAAFGIQSLALLIAEAEGNSEKDVYESELDKDEERLSTQAEKLEMMAEDLELLEADMDSIHTQLRQQIPSLNELGWF
jgi:hypothetical protein